MLKRFIPLACAIASGPAAFANGAVDSSPLGGLQFEHAVDIAIAKEQLFLSAKQIRVHYIYRSDANAPQAVNISFPLAKNELLYGPGSIDTMNEGREGQKDFDPRNYMQFHVSVNGAAVAPKLREYAWAIADSRDVSEALRAAKIPLFLTEADLKALNARKDEPAIAKLVADGILDNTGMSDGSLLPYWEYQVVYYWQQSFAPGDTVVDVSYTPMNGSGGEYNHVIQNPAEVKAACVDATLLAAIDKLQAAGYGWEPEWMGYILDTARYWKGPIGRFEMTVEKPEPADANSKELVAFCPLDAKKISDRQWLWTADNFVPKANVRVVFFHFWKSG